MKKYYLTLALILPIMTYGQTKKSTPWGRDKEERKANPYVKIKAGAATIGMGGILLAGSVVMLGEAKTQNGKTPAYIIAGGGGVLCFLGGVLLGKGASMLMKNQNVAGLKFTGTSLALRF
jgi:hypothetical protein